MCPFFTDCSNTYTGIHVDKDSKYKVVHLVFTNGDVTRNLDDYVTESVSAVMCFSYKNTYVQELRPNVCKSCCTDVR
jgi:hypothetical protein